MPRQARTVALPPSLPPRRRPRMGCSPVAFLLLLALTGAGIFGWLRLRPGGAGIPLTITPPMLQAGLDKAFPIDKRELFLNVHLSDPAIQLDTADGDRIGFGAKVGVASGGRKLANGTVNATGKLRYDADSGTFYLDDPKIKQLDIDRVNGGIAGPVRKAVSYVLNKAVRHLAVYQLDPNDPLQKAAKRGIRSVRVTGGAVEVRVGLNPAP